MLPNRARRPTAGIASAPFLAMLFTYTALPTPAAEPDQPRAELFGRFERDESVSYVAFSADGQKVFFASGTVHRTVNSDGPKQVVRELTLSSGESRIVAQPLKREVEIVRDSGAEQTLRVLSTFRDRGGFTLETCGQTFADRQPVGRAWLQDFSPGGTKTALSPDGSCLAILHAAARIYRVPAAGPPRVLQGKDSSCLSGCFSLDSSLIALGDSRGKVSVWKLDRNEAPAVYQLSDGPITAVAFSADASLLVAASGKDGDRWKSTRLSSYDLKSGHTATRVDAAFPVSRLQCIPGTACVACQGHRKNLAIRSSNDLCDLINIEVPAIASIDVNRDGSRIVISAEPEYRYEPGGISVYDLHGLPRLGD